MVTVVVIIKSYSFCRVLPSIANCCCCCCSSLCTIWPHFMEIDAIAVGTAKYTDEQQQ